MKEKQSVFAPPGASVEISNGRAALISGCRGIVSFSDTEIGVSTGGRPVTVKGRHLVLSWAGEGRLMIKGEISSVEFGRDEK